MQGRYATEAVWELVESGVCDSQDVWDAVRRCVDNEDLMHWVRASLREKQTRPLRIDWGCVLQELISWH